MCWFPKVAQQIWAAPSKYGMCMHEIGVHIPYLPTCLKPKAGQNLWNSGIFGLKSGHSLKPYENSQIYQVNRPNSVQKCCKKSGTKQRKIRTAVNFEPKIRTVPLKVGQLESMTFCNLSTKENIPKFLRFSWLPQRHEKPNQSQVRWFNVGHYYLRLMYI